MDRARKITEQFKKQDLPEFSAGDTLKVHSIIKEVDAKGVEKQRIQAFQGVCIKKRNAGLASTFTVRKISDGVGVERIYPVHSPMISKIEVVNKGAVRRANISYFKKLTGKAARIKREETSREITAGDASNGSNNAAE
ncbi:MAG TPA: 50S ribosomal protein L19 [bacterium]|jgi:large subunit ribosomal protein L19|nr:50S ribosomal protein L19 [bacterium]